eukprot:m.237882 g.237882  ORF g.237882 m.237882 type:complete len:523 (+) comp21461_c0_seq1:196-1764(+)
MVDKYNKLRVLGSGTYGRAWLVKEKETQQQFVMKEIKVANKRELEEAKTEAELLSKFDHPNIIKYHEVIQTGSKVVNIVMEYAAGGDLQSKLVRRKMANSPFTQEEVMAWLAQTCDALLLIHKEGMLHRDIKLANMFLTQDDQIKIGDFGIARVLDHNAINISARTCRTPVGTPMYMAPELCQGKAYGQKADMWALGCALYELMTFTPAFNAQSLEGLMHRIKRGRYEQNLPPIYSRDLQNLVYDLLKVNTAERPSIKEVVARPLLAPFALGERAAAAPPVLASHMSPHRHAALERLTEESECGSSVVRAGTPKSDLRPLNLKRQPPPRAPAGAAPAAAPVERDALALPPGAVRPARQSVPESDPRMLGGRHGDITPARGDMQAGPARRRLMGDDARPSRDMQGGGGGVGVDGGYSPDHWGRDAADHLPDISPSRHARAAPAAAPARPSAGMLPEVLPPARLARGEPGYRVGAGGRPMLIVEQDSQERLHIQAQPRRAKPEAPSMLDLVGRYHNAREPRRIY